ncbi:hypothetical protein P7C70_g1111, partial [Phenoliferia sp. Uapishka_3]
MPKAAPTRQRDLRRKANLTESSDSAKPSRSSAHLGNIVAQHRRLFEEGKSPRDQIEISSDEEDASGEEEDDEGEFDENDSDDELMLEELEVSHSHIGSNLRTATAAAPPPPTRSPRDPFPLPRIKSAVSLTVTFKVAFEANSLEKSRPDASLTFRIAPEVIGHEGDAPVFSTSEVFNFVHMKFPKAVRLDHFEGRPTFWTSPEVDASRKVVHGEEFIAQADEDDWSDLSCLGPEEDRLCGTMVGVGCAKVQIIVKGRSSMSRLESVSRTPSKPPSPKSRHSSAHSRQLSASKYTLSSPSSSESLPCGLYSDADSIGDLSEGDDGIKSEPRESHVVTSKTPRQTSRSRPLSTGSKAPEKSDSFLVVPVDRAKAKGTQDELEAVRTAIENTATSLSIPWKRKGDDSPRPRISSPKLWMAQWRNIESIGSALKWEVVEAGKGVAFGPPDVAAVLSWGSNYWDHRRTYDAFIAQQDSPDVREVLASNGASLTTYKALKALLGLEGGAGSSPLKQKRIRSPHQESDSDVGEVESWRKKIRKVEGQGDGARRTRSLFSTIYPPHLLLLVVFIAFVAPVSATSPRLSELAEMLPEDFTAMQLYFAVGIILTNLQLARLSAGQLEYYYKESVGQGRARFTAWIKALSRLVPFSSSGEEASDHRRIQVAVEVIASAIDSDLMEEEDKPKPLSRTTYPRKPHVLLTTRHITCPQCGGGYLQKLSTTKEVILLDTDGPRTGSVLECRCTRCKTTLYPDRHRVRFPHSTEVVDVYDGGAEFIRLGNRYWATRRFSNSIVLQLYNHLSFAAACTVYHEGIDEDRLSRAAPHHFFRLFVLDIILRHSQSTGSPFYFEPKLGFRHMIRSANEELFAGGRRLVQHDCTTCAHRAVNQKNPALKAGEAHEVAAANRDGTGRLSRPTEDIKEEDEPAETDRRFCLEHREIHFGADCFDVRCGVVDCEERMIRRTLFPNDLIPTDDEDSPEFILREITEEDMLLEKYPCCPDHRQALDDFLSRNGNAADYHAVKQWNRDARNLRPSANADSAPWRTKHTEHVSKVLRSTWHAQRYNNLEVIVRPCGVPVSATRMLLAEDDDEMIKFLEETFKALDPTKEAWENRPSFLGHDRACRTIRRLIETGKWDEDNWAETTRLLVDRLHYLGHKESDKICVEFCNPAPMDGSQPDLVVQDPDDPSKLLRAFNTSASEQINAWLVGFAPSVTRMRSENFDFFIHGMLWFHGKRREESLECLV